MKISRNRVILWLTLSLVFIIATTGIVGIRSLIITTNNSIEMLYISNDSENSFTFKLNNATKISQPELQKNQEFDNITNAKSGQTSLFDNQSFVHQVINFLYRTQDIGNVLIPSMDFANYIGKSIIFKGI